MHRYRKPKKGAKRMALYTDIEATVRAILGPELNELPVNHDAPETLSTEITEAVMRVIEAHR